ncbi:hypothetical protein BJ165DRAFT_1398425 [Panaeolus papilionaceus]|nr:hypothetical protein BJ165DRAFT_1398425 [Panaeolus papilionaceus]
MIYEIKPEELTLADFVQDYEQRACREERNLCEHHHYHCGHHSPSASSSSLSRELSEELMPPLARTYCRQISVFRRKSKVDGVRNIKIQSFTTAFKCGNPCEEQRICARRVKWVMSGEYGLGMLRRSIDIGAAACNAFKSNVDFVERVPEMPFETGIKAGPI